MIGARPVKYMLSFTLRGPGSVTDNRARSDGIRLNKPWIAKLDTVVTSVHIDPEHNGIRQNRPQRRHLLAHCHSHQFFEQVAAMVTEYLNTRPDPGAYDFLQHDFAGLETHHGGVVGTSFRTFPSYPHRFLEALSVQPACDADIPGIEVQPIRKRQQPLQYTENDLHIRQFMTETSRRLVRKGQFRAA